jgi:hypothetical protein
LNSSTSKARDRVGGQKRLFGSQSSCQTLQLVQRFTSSCSSSVYLADATTRTAHHISNSSNTLVVTLLEFHTKSAPSEFDVTCLLPQPRKYHFGSNFTVQLRLDNLSSLCRSKSGTSHYFDCRAPSKVLRCNRSPELGLLHNESDVSCYEPEHSPPIPGMHSPPIHEIRMRKYISGNLPLDVAVLGSASKVAVYF